MDAIQKLVYLLGSGLEDPLTEKNITGKAFSKDDH